MVAMFCTGALSPSKLDASYRVFETSYLSERIRNSDSLLKSREALLKMNAAPCQRRVYHLPRRSIRISALLLLYISIHHSTAFLHDNKFIISRSRSLSEKSFNNSIQRGTTQPSTTSLSAINIEEVLYNAQSVASSLANLCLKQDPSNLVSSLPIMYGAGLLTSFSPCVWGLLPLTMSYISTAAGDREDQQAILPTVAFAAGLAVVFCSLGVAAAELGGVFGGSNGTSGTVLAVVSNAICLIMGFQLLELVSLPLPSLEGLMFRSKKNDGPVLIDGTGQILSDKQNDEAGSLLRTFLLGGSSALVASPCATPVLTSILGFVASSKSPLLGAALLFGYTVGYSTPLLLVASTGGQALAKLRQSNSGVYGKIAPWVTPFTAGILLWYGTDGLLTAVLGDASLAGLASQVIE
jgi:cytochrome c-type biogenesis protein